MKMIYDQPPIVENDGLSAEERKTADNVRGRLFLASVIISIIVGYIATGFVGDFFSALIGLGAIIASIVIVSRISDKKCKEMDYEPKPELYDYKSNPYDSRNTSTWAKNTRGW